MPIIYDLETDIRYLQGKQKGAEEAIASFIIRNIKEEYEKGYKEGYEKSVRETKTRYVKGVSLLGILTPEQIATALDVSVEFVLTVQAQVKSEDNDFKNRKFS